jgi:hypothetical protein
VYNDHPWDLKKLLSYLDLGNIMLIFSLSMKLPFDKKQIKLKKEISIKLGEIVLYLNDLMQEVPYLHG